MQLKYRGIAYTPSPTETITPQKTVEGRYHGLPTEISLPCITESIEELIDLMVYRGICY